MPSWPVPLLIALLATAGNAQKTWRQFYQEAARLLSEREPKAAIAELDHRLADDADNAELLCLRCVAKRTAGDRDGALADVTRAIELAPRFSSAFVERGYLRQAQNDLAGAIADFSEAIRVEPDNPMAWADRGDAHQERGDHRAALADYDEAIRLHAGYGAAFYNRARMHVALGDAPAAVRDFRRATRLIEARPQMWLELAKAEAGLGRFDDAERSLGRGIRAAGDHAALLLYERARLRWRRNDASGAREDFAAILAARAGNGGTWPERWLGALELCGGDAAAARAHFERAAADPELAPWAYLLLWCTTTGSDATGDLLSAFRALPAPPDPFFDWLVDLCADETPEPISTSGEDDENAYHHFFAGWRARRLGHEAEALAHWRRCVNLGSVDSLEWLVAFAQLQRAGREFTSTLGMTIADVEGAAPPQVEVTALVDGGAAALQGVQVGDRVLMVNAQPATAATFADSIKDLPVGAPVRLEVLVDGKPVAGWLRTGIE